MKEDAMNSSPILKGKQAVVFGAGGSIGTAVAKEFAKEGAEVFLSGRTKTTVEAVAAQIMANGGRAHAAAIDTLDDAAVNQYIDGILSRRARSTSFSMPPALSPNSMGMESSRWTCPSTSSWCHSTRWSGRA